MSPIAFSTPTTDKKIWTDAELMALTDFTMKNGNKRSPDISFMPRKKLKGLID